MEFSGPFDFVIFGEHPAGLWVAKRLLSLEKKVLVLPLGKDGGLNSVPRSVIQDFGWTEEFLKQDVADPVQILTRDRRFRVGRSLEELNEEYRFQFGEAPGVNPSPEILRGLAYLSRGADTGPCFSEDWESWCLRALDTVHLDHERGYLVKQMLHSLAESGAQIARPSQLKQIFIDKKSLVGVQLEGTSKIIPVNAGVIASHYDLVKSLMNDSGPSLSDPMGWTFDLGFECAPSSLPKGLSKRMLYLEPGAPVLEILHEIPGRFQLRTPLPFSDKSLNRSFQRRLCERMIQVCERIIPDLEYNLRRVSPNLRDPEKTETVDLPARFPFEDLHRVPLERVFYGAGRNLGFQSPFANLFIVSEESNPSLGLRGAYQAALQTFEALNKRDQVNHYLSTSMANSFQ